MLAMTMIRALLALALAANYARAFAPSNAHHVVVTHGQDHSSIRGRGHFPLHASRTKELTSLTVVELKGLLRAQGCTVSGRKAELIQRLEQSFAVDVVIADGVSNSGSDSPIISKKRPAVRERKEESREQKQSAALKKKKTVAISDVNLDEEFDSIFVKPAASPAVAVAAKSDDNANSVNDKAETPSKVVPSVSTGFADMGLPGPVTRQLNKMKITEPTPIQQRAIPLAFDGRDVMGLAQTGTGKTLAFGVPLVSKLLDGGEHDARNKRNELARPGGVSALVLAPTRELANQISEQLESLTAGTPIRSMVVYGGGPRVQTQANKLRNGVHILVATPGRLLDLLDRGAITLRDCRFLTLDEADMMLDMGFTPSLKKIVKQLPPKRQTMLFSATMNKSMAEVAKLYLTNPVRVEVAKVGMTADKVTQEVHFIAKMDKMSKLTSLMKKHEGERALVFGRTKRGMEKLCNRLNHAGIKATSIHGNKSQPQRDRALREFKSGQTKVLVATDVAARGLDIPEVKHVYNYELPDQAENYVHRIGRTARAGKEGAAIAFCSMEEMNDLEDIQKIIGIEIPVASGTPWRTSRKTKPPKKMKYNQNQSYNSNDTARRVFRRR